MTTLGKARAMAACSTPAGHFNILAIDHRGNLQEALAKHGPADDDAIIAFKRDVVSLLAPEASAVLIDPQYGIAPGTQHGWLPAHLGLLAPLEVTDYTLHPGQRAFRPIPDWSASKIRRVGGSGVKLLLYYHPQAPTAQAQRALAASIARECARLDLPLFLEPIVYSPDASRPLSPSGHREAVIAAAAEFSAVGIDVLKTQFPADASVTDEREWRAALRELDAVCTVPWTLLSAGVGYSVFRQQAALACEAGASGVIVGRAVWNEAVDAPSPEARRDLLRGLSVPRVRELAAICASGRPWRERTPLSLSPGWMARYDGLD
jgi:tagatose 1,6-diphosphate aldolase